MKLHVAKRDQLLMSIPLWVLIRPLARPRFSPKTGRAYTPLEEQKPLFAALEHYEQVHLSLPVIVDMYINIERPQNCQLPWPTRPVDGDDDNLRKAISDALVKRGILADDRFIIGGETYKCWGEDDVAYILISSAKPHVEELP